ncbi:hypothetical protein ACERIT_06400 [Halopenitus sp. H-Gu1]
MTDRDLPDERPTDPSVAFLSESVQFSTMTDLREYAVVALEAIDVR